ncbi:hypothetical protein BJ165DRAFT_1407586 [Panaeolus papilionaceus]|nr:hypothetical protein BJ165DRAFT_1407586 [Panaeolus papilionaceus]
MPKGVVRQLKSRRMCHGTYLVLWRGPTHSRQGGRGAKGGNMGWGRLKRGAMCLEWWLRGWGGIGNQCIARALLPAARGPCARCDMARRGVERGGSSAGGGEELVVELSEQVVVVAVGEQGRHRWLEGVAGVVVIVVGSNSECEERGREGGSRGGRKGRGRGWEREKNNDSDEYQTITCSI